MLWARILADAIVVFHAAFVAFVVLGMVAIVLGLALRRGWVRNFWFRTLHLAAIGVVTALTLAGMMCPLTVLGESTEAAGGAAVVSGGFHRLLGAPAHLLRRRALGLHARVYPVRPAGPGDVRVRASPLARRGRPGGRRATSASLTNHRRRAGPRLEVESGRRDEVTPSAWPPPRLRWACRSRSPSRTTRGSSSAS